MAEENITILSEVLDIFGQKGRLEIEIKSFNTVCVEKAAELIKNAIPLIMK